MPIPAVLQNLRVPVIGSPLFIISVPKLVIAQCKAGIVGSFPALNAREGEGEHPLLDTWLTEIREELDRHNQANPDRPAAPFAVNQIVHRSNGRLERDLEICVKHEVPIWITSLGARVEVNEAFNAKLQETAARTVWAHPGATSWYKNDRGHLTTTSPWRLVDYWKWTRHPDPADYHWR